MLQKPDPKTEMLLRLADYVEASKHFDMRRWCDCIAGHTVELFGQYHDGYWYAWSDRSNTAADILDLKGKDAVKLFQTFKTDDVAACTDRKQAASVIRHYAQTGKVDWNIGKVKETV